MVVVEQWFETHYIYGPSSTRFNPSAARPVYIRFQECLKPNKKPSNKTQLFMLDVHQIISICDMSIEVEYRADNSTFKWQKILCKHSNTYIYIYIGSAIIDLQTLETYIYQVSSRVEKKIVTRCRTF